MSTPRLLSSWLKYLCRFRLAPFVPVPPAVGRRMLRLAELRPGEVLVDFSTAYGPFKELYQWLTATRGVEVPRTARPLAHTPSLSRNSLASSLSLYIRPRGEPLCGR